MLYKLEKMWDFIFSTKSVNRYVLMFIAALLLNGCNGKLPGGDARKFPDDPKLRVKKKSRRRERF